MKKSYKNKSITIWLLMLIASITPLIVRLKIRPLSTSTRKIIQSIETNADLFSYYKTIFFIILTTILLITYIINDHKDKNLNTRPNKIYISILVYILFTILSTAFSTTKDIALIGFMDRYEGVFVLIGYMICLYISINSIKNEEEVKSIFKALSISIILISIIGILQFIGKDIFTTEIGKKLIIPSKYQEYTESMNFVFNDRRMIYGTFYNPNYIGVYMSMVFPISCTMAILFKEKKIKIYSGLISILALFILIGSGSKTGIISIFFYMLLAIIFFRKFIFKKWKYILTASILFIIISLSMNHYNNQMITKRIEIFMESFKTKENRLEDIILKENTARILIGNYELQIEYDGSFFTFYDDHGQELDTTISENTIYFKSEPYSSHHIDLKTHEDNFVLINNIQSDDKLINFMLIALEDGSIKYLDPSMNIIDLKSAPKLGFSGKEDFATGRGYTWSRSIPLLKDTIFIGYGPDTYVANYPQDDYVGLLKYMYNDDLIMDRPHNLYLQIGINTGIISLISLLIIFITYLFKSYKLYINKMKFIGFYEIAGISIFFGICNYLLMGIFNDSYIGAASTFWILLGMGIYINTKLQSDLDIIDN